jgi:hypothetical protein
VFEGRALLYAIDMDEKTKGFGGQLLLEAGMETGVPPNGEASTLEVDFVKIDYIVLPDIMLISSITEAEFRCVSEIPDVC